MQKDPGKEFFTFTKKERLGVFAVLGGVLLIFICVNYLYPWIIKEEPPNKAAIIAGSAVLKENQKESSDNAYSNNSYSTERGQKNYSKGNNEKEFSGEMFYFDPNTLSVAGWERLGLRDKTIATIRNYVAKGGKFREPDDLRKIWGLRDEEKERLVPYIRIAESSRPAPSSGTYTNSYQPYEKKVYEKKIAQPVEINSGDSAAFDALPGIGPGYSRRIINFRNRLGGFYKVEQVAETFGLPDSVYQQIKPLLKISGEGIRKINLNTATNEELKAHPYIRWQLANVITEYKKQHGNFKALSDLKKIMVIDEETYRKISPYLSL